MAKIDIRLSEKEWDIICKEIWDLYFISLNTCQMREVVSKDQFLLLNVAQLVNSRNGYCDEDLWRVVRPKVINAIALELTGQKFPTLDEFEEMGQKKTFDFYSDFTKKAREKGYKTPDHLETLLLWPDGP